MSQLGEALTDPDLEPPVKALVVWSSNPAQVAPEQERVLAGLRREDLFTVVIEQFMTDTAAHADVILPATTQLEHLDAVFSWGHHYFTLNEPAIEPLGEAKPTTETFRLLAARMGFDDPALRRDRRGAAGRSCSTATPAASRWTRLRERGWQKIDLGQGPDAARRGQLRHPDGQARAARRLARRRGGRHAAVLRPAGGGGRRELAGRFPLALVTPKTHLFLNSTFANQERQHSAQPEPYVVIHPDDAASRGVADGALVRVFNERGSFRCRATSPTTPARGLGRADGLVGARLRRRASAPRRPPRSG